MECSQSEPAVEAAAADTIASAIADAEQRLSDLQEQIQTTESRRARMDLEHQMNELRDLIAANKFKATNKTSFDGAGDRAVLGVTSGLDIPTKPLPCIPTSEMIERRAAPPTVSRGKGKRRGAAAGAAPKTGLVDAGGQYSCSPGEVMLAEGHEHGFIAAVTAAFKDHYPLTLRPQHFWLMVAQGVATHVDLNAEVVRASWVRHEGKKTLEVRCNDFVMGKPNDWASTVSGKPDSFAVQIAANTVPGVAEALAPPFSATTVVEDIAQKIVVMDICKNYFAYKCSTLCGFPQITLEGSEADWRLLREASERLLQRCTPDFQEQWGKSLLPLLDKLLAARSGEVDATFWNSMCKRGGSSGSGSRTWFNGWFNILFPYIDRRPNRYCVPYSPDAGYVREGLVYDKRYGMLGGKHASGPDCEDFGNGMSSVPVEWDYLGQSVPLDFNAGFVGATQDPDTLEIRPVVGWFITHRSVELAGTTHHTP